MMNGMETIRPTIDMMFDLYRHCETWIFNDCAIGYNHGRFSALIVRRFTEGPYKGCTYYGFVRDLIPICGKNRARIALDEACAEFGDCPKIFDRQPSWDLVEGGNRYV